MKKCLVFFLSKDETLNQNSIPKTFIRSSKAKAIRKLAHKLGIENRDDTDTKASDRLDAINKEQELSNAKGRIRRNKKKKGMTDEQVEEMIVKAQSDLSPETPSSDMDVSYLFEHYKVVVTIFSLNRGRIDPPNFYPTLKPFIDGLTDCSWWPDDNFNYMHSIEFRYGGVTPRKGLYCFAVEVEEVNPDDHEVEESLLLETAKED